MLLCSLVLPSVAHAVCYNPMEDNGAGGCVFKPAHHECGKTTSATNFASPVAPEITGANADLKFDNTINKKLACCMNVFGLTDPFAKFDCIQNSKDSYTDFNALWSSSDDLLYDGGQMNAILLLNGGGKPITGFYGLNGGRCDEFSEFAASGPIQPYRVGTGATPIDSTIPLPPSLPYDEIKSKIGKSFPSTVIHYKRCPILVRAAIMATCPMNPVLPIAQKTAVLTSGGVARTRCSAAGNIMIQIRMEQIYEIEGQVRLQPYDTMIERSQAGSISTQMLIQQKLGYACEPGTSRKNNVCVY